MQSVILLRKGVSKEVDTVFGRGAEFLNRLFTTSLQGGISQVVDSTNPSITLNSSSKGGVRESFFDIDLTREGISSLAYHFYRDGRFKKDLKLFKDGKWEKLLEDNGYILINGKWERENQRYRVEGKYIILDEAYRIESVNSRDISGQHSIKGLDINMPRGSKIYSNTVEQFREMYILDDEVSDLNIYEFISKFSKKEWFDGFKYGGISFGDTKLNRRAGKLWYLNRVDKKVEVVSKDAGEWQVENVDGVDVLRVSVKEQHDMVFANIQGKLFRGSVSKPQKLVKHYYNKTAFEAIIRLLEERV